MSAVHRFALLVLLALSLSPAAALAWPHALQGQLIASGAYSPRVASDPAGGCYVAYMMYNYTSGDYDAYVQRYDSKGGALWPAPGALLCSAPDVQSPVYALPDGEGGVIVVWADMRAGGYSEQDYYAQRVTPGGALYWQANGVAIATGAGAQTGLRAAVNTTGLTCVWTDPRNSGTTGNDIYAQTLYLWSGALVGPVNGMPVCVQNGDQVSPDFVLDDIGYLRVVWADARSGTHDIYAQRLGWSGNPMYTTNGVPVCNAVSTQSEPRVAIGPGGRTLVAWSDLRGANFDVYAQLIDEYSGSAYWASNGVVVSGAPGAQFLAGMERDAQGNVAVAWYDQSRSYSLQDLYVQKLDFTGAAQWGSAGVLVRLANGSAGYLSMLPDGTGGLYLAWGDSRSDISDVYMQRVNAYGAIAWTPNGVPIGLASGSQTVPILAPVAGGTGVYVVNEDYSPVTGGRLQRVDEWGYTGANPILASVKDIPNDQGGQVKVSWYGSPLDTDPLYRNISDYVVYRSVPTALVAQLARAAVPSEDGVSLNGKRYLRTTYAAQDYFWEELAHVTPRHLSTYSYVAATEGDSMGGSNKKTAFMIMAVANYGASWWTSDADSGYSVDNVAPAAPAPLTGQYSASGTALHWDPNAEADLAGYRVYRGSSVSFTPSASTLVATVSDTGYVASGSTPYFYKLTAIDIHGNESPVATLMPSGTLGVGDGAAARAEFAAPAPNPLRGGATSTLRFSLAVGGRTKLALYDAQGRVVRTLVDGAREAGAHTVALRGDGLAPGLYLARLEAPGFTGVRRVMVVE